VKGFGKRFEPEDRGADSVLESRPQSTVQDGQVQHYLESRLTITCRGRASGNFFVLTFEDLYKWLDACRSAGFGTDDEITLAAYYGGPPLSVSRVTGLEAIAKAPGGAALEGKPRGDTKP